MDEPSFRISKLDVLIALMVAHVGFNLVNPARSRLSSGRGRSRYPPCTDWAISPGPVPAHTAGQLEGLDGPQQFLAAHSFHRVFHSIPLPQIRERG